MNYLSKIVAVVDADYFELQIYQKLNHQNRRTIGFPCILTDASKRVIISVSPEAKKFLIKREMSVQKAMQLCPGLKIIKKGRRFNKQENKLVRIASTEMRDAIIQFFENYRASRNLDGPVEIEKNGCDEYFMDLTLIVDEIIREMKEFLKFNCNENIFVETKKKCYRGDELIAQNRRLFVHIDQYRFAMAAQLSKELVDYLKETTGYKYSVGIGSNKVKAKIAVKLHRPMGITILTDSGLETRISQQISFRDVMGLGGKLGDLVEHKLGPLTMSQLKCRCKSHFHLFKQWFGHENAIKIRQLSHGICNNSVLNKPMFETLSCGKYNLKLNGEESAYRRTISDLTSELVERLREEANVHFRHPRKIILQLTMTLPSGKERIKKFPLDLATTAEGLAHPAIVHILKAVYKASVQNNIYFKCNLKYITGICFFVPSFAVLKPSDENELLEAHVEIYLLTSVLMVDRLTKYPRTSLMDLLF